MSSPAFRTPYSHSPELHLLTDVDRGPLFQPAFPSSISSSTAFAAACFDASKAEAGDSTGCPKRLVQNMTQRAQEMEERNRQLHRMNQLTLNAADAKAESLSNTISHLENDIISMNRALIDVAYAHKLTLANARRATEMNIASLKAKCLVEKEPERKVAIMHLLRQMETDMAEIDTDIQAAVDVHTACEPPAEQPFMSLCTELATAIRLSSQQFNGSTPGTLDVEELEIEGRQVEVDKVHRTCTRPLESLIADETGIPHTSMKRHCKPPPRERGLFRGVFDTLRDLKVCQRPRTVSYRSRSSSSSLIFLLGIFILVIGMAQVAHASAPPASTSTLSVYALNANGLMQPVKQSSINSAIRARCPQVFVIGETKTKSKLSKSLPFDEYDIYEESGEQDESHHPVKWGIVVGIRKDIQIAQRVELKHRSLKGRVVALDIILPTSDGRCFSHRFIGAYAPWNPGDAGVGHTFWTDLTDLCKSTPNSWTVAGDLNATVTSFERASGGNEARTQFLKFLDSTNALDVWTNYPDRNRQSDWTCKGHQPDSSRFIPEGNIIDRVVTSKPTLVDSEISVVNQYNDRIPYTDHRAVVARVTHALPGVSQGDFDHASGAFVRKSSHNARIKVPLKSEKDKYQAFADIVDKEILARGLRDMTVTDDASFIELYTGLSSIINANAAKTFGRTKPYVRTAQVVTNATIRSIVSEIKHVGGAIRFERSNRIVHVSLKAMKHHNKALHFLHRSSGNHLTLLDFLNGHRRSLHKKLFSERSKEISERAKRADRCRMAAALNGNSTRKLVQAGDFIPLPLAVNDLDNPERLVCDPQGVKATTRNYFQRLYDHSRVPAMPKPWMDTPSVTEVRDRVTQNQFSWPRKALLADLRALLRKGNNRPSPGPDQWEKWIIKSLSDSALSRVLALLNYMIMKSRFPGDVKDMWLTMFHKRNLRTDLKNWRGLMLSNLLANLPMAWLNACLVRYSADIHILPDTQVAAQPGVQTRDLMSFLAGVKCWAARHKQTVYAIKRDQMKGFDYLSPEGFYDAIKAYGLPDSIIDLDRASQTETRCFIRTAYGITDPITISGLNKQGGPASPLKSVLTTSLGSYFLYDLLRRDQDALIISPSCMERGDPHLQDAETKLLIGMVEATDDTYIFSRSLPSLVRNTLAMERFQYAYGWLTQWSKSRAFVLSGVGSQPAHVTFESVSTENGTDPLIVSKHQVECTANELDFLRTKVNDPTARFEELKAFIESFKFPTVIGRLPITLIRKIVSQNIISRCRALLSLQPLKQTDAEMLDKAIMRKVHDILGFPFQPNTMIATLPVSHHGFGFPSIARINAGLAVEGLMRDLNHHIPAYRAMAKITLTDWMCEKSNCIYPLDGPGLRKDFSQCGHSIPSAWLTAHKVLKKLDLSLREIDQAYMAKGDVSLSHLVRSCSHSCPQISSVINGMVLRSLRLKGIRLLKDAGKWMIDKNGNITSYLSAPAFDKSWSAAARQNWQRLFEAIHLKLGIDNVLPGPADLVIPLEMRKQYAEQLISSLANICQFEPSRNSDETVWASDGSMLPSSAGVLDKKAVVGAATGSRTLAMRIPGSNVSILHGELMGLISALVLSTSAESSDSQDRRLLTDHLNTVRLVEDSQTGIDQTPRLRFMNGRSYYRWLLDLVKRTDLRIEYTPGHSTEESLESTMNNEADFFASASQKYFRHLPKAPTPTFFMNSFTFHSETDGWIESNILTYIDALMTRSTANELGSDISMRMSTWAHDKQPPPDYPYVRALSAHSAAVQLYARSGQLATADVLVSRGKLEDRTCRLGCDANESIRHIFVHCQRYEQWRKDAGKQVVEKTELKLNTMEISGDMKDKLLAAAKSLFVDNPEIWPLHLTMFYLGQIPDLDTLIHPNHGMNDITLKRLKVHLSSDWHTSSIRLAGRIFGDFQRRMAVLNNIPLKKPMLDFSSSRTYNSHRRR